MQAWHIIILEVIRFEHIGDTCLGEANWTSYWINVGFKESCKMWREKNAGNL